MLSTSDSIPPPRARAWSPPWHRHRTRHRRSGRRSQSADGRPRSRRRCRSPPTPCAARRRPHGRRAFIAAGSEARRRSASGAALTSVGSIGPVTTAVTVRRSAGPAQPIDGSRPGAYRPRRCRWGRRQVGATHFPAGVRDGRSAAATQTKEGSHVLAEGPPRFVLGSMAVGLAGLLAPMIGASGAGAGSSAVGRRARRAARGQAARRRDRRRPRAERHDLRPDDAGEPDPGRGRRHRHAAGAEPVRAAAVRAAVRARHVRHAPPTRSTSRSATTRRSPASGVRPPTWSSTARSTSATSATPAACIALNNFWRSLSNLTINVTTPDFGCYTGEFWAVSQAAPMRRVHVNGQTTLMDYCTGPSFASGGFIADSQFDGTVINGSQQQWLTATASSTAGATASGTRSSPASSARRRSASRPGSERCGPYTTLATSPVTP